MTTKDLIHLALHPANAGIARTLIKSWAILLSLIIKFLSNDALLFNNFTWV
jgi:hypothetical protein